MVKSNKAMQKNLVVIGGGAAGFFCAVNAARLAPQLRVVVLEKNGKVLQKVRISGGGRCNVTHHLFQTGAFAKCYPRGEKFLKNTLRHFSASDTVAWFAARGVQLKAEADGRMFPDTDSSETIIRCLLQEADRYGVQVRMQQAVQHLQALPEGRWLLQLAGNAQLEADYVCVAAGGAPKAEQMQWLTRSTGHSVVNPVPSLFTFNLPGHSITGLMGVAVPVRLRIAGTAFESEGPLLITHWGLSGPAVLRTSAFAARHLAQEGYIYTVVVNWLPHYHENSLRQMLQEYRLLKPTQKVLNSEWARVLPGRLWLYLLEQAGIGQEQRWHDLPAALQNKLVKQICSWEAQAQGKTTYKEEFVTAGGIALGEVQHATLQSRLHPHLYFAGEVLDVDGITGGFNFQHAWTSGYIAAKAIAAAMQQHPTSTIA